MKLFRLHKTLRNTSHLFSSPDIESIHGNYVSSILEDKAGSIWIGTIDGGLDKINILVNKKKEPKILYSNPFKIQSGNECVTSLCLVNDQIWVGTLGAGLKFFNLSGFELKPAAVKFSANDIFRRLIIMTRITKIKTDIFGNVWIGTFGHGLFKLSKKEGQLANFKYDPANLNSLTDNDVISLAADRTGLIWAGTFSGYGINKLNQFQSIFHCYSAEPQKPNSLSDRIITSFTEDNSGNIWIGTYKGGLNKISPNSKVVRTYLPGIHITSLCLDNDLLWIGTYDQGLYLLNLKNNQFQRFRKKTEHGETLSSDQITSVVKDGYGIIWAATMNCGLNKIVKEKKMFRFNHYRHSDIFPSTLPSDNIKRLFIDNDGELWTADNNGDICKFVRTTEDFFCIREAELKKAEIYSFYDDNSHILLGTNGNGILKIDKKKLKLCQSDNSLIFNNRSICGITTDSRHNIWLSTDNGIYVYDIRSQFVQHFTQSDGLNSLRFYPGSSFKAKNGQIFFGSNNGYTAFLPDSFNVIHIKPLIRITSFKTLNKELPLTGNDIELSYDQNSFTAEFSTLEHLDPLKNQFSFILYGYENHWRSVKGNEHAASYVGLPPGDYIFKVIGSNSSGIWDKKGQELRIHISSPFYRSWWFVTIALASLISLTGAFVLQRLKQYTEMTKLKSKLSADLHDSVGSGLTEISLLCEIVKRDSKDSPLSVRENLQLIGQRSRELIDNMSEIVWLVNPKLDSLHDLIIRLRDTYQPICASSGINFLIGDFEKIRNLRLSMESKQNIFLILKESINNSLKYSRAKTISLDFRSQKSKLSFLIKDDGCGFDIQQKTSGNGLITMRQRAKSIGGECIIDSHVSKGTTIELLINIS